MLRSAKSDGIPLPKGWPRRVRSAVLPACKSSARCPGYVIDQVEARKEGGAAGPWPARRGVIPRSTLASNRFACQAERSRKNELSVDPRTNQTRRVRPGTRLELSIGFRPAGASRGALGKWRAGIRWTPAAPP
jgi:hypothetical protein